TSTTFDAERNAWLASCESLASKASAAGALKGSRTETRDVRPLQTSYKGRFEQSGPISLWVADMTQQHTDEGWLYLAVVVDAFSRRVIGWSMGERPVADLPIGAVRMAVWNRRPDPGVIHHS